MADAVLGGILRELGFNVIEGVDDEIDSVVDVVADLGGALMGYRW